MSDKTEEISKRFEQTTTGNKGFRASASLALSPNERGEAPKLRYPRARDAYAALYWHQYNDSLRSTMRAQVRAIIDGNAPFTEKQLKK